MTHQQIETGREIRLWISQVILPSIMVVSLVASNPKVKDFVSDKVRGAKRFIRCKFKKIES
jgi:hypothetical protein